MRPRMVRRKPRREIDPHAGVNLSTREMFSLDCPDDCDNYGEFLASQGDVGSLVTYLGMSTNEDDAYTLVRVWTA